MQIVKEKNGKIFSLSSKELDFVGVSILNNELSRKILTKLKAPMYPKQLAKEIKVHEQKVYYYIRKLESAKLISIVKNENINGTIANYYKVSSDSFFFKVSEFEESTKIISKESDYLKPFILEGHLNALIVVGSPDPHGPQKARSRDGYFGMDLALFLGTFINLIPDSRVKLDTEISEKELRENNLIVLGGPIVNKVSSEINSNLPIYFDEEKKGVYSKITKRVYHDEEIGYINKIKSPYNKDKEILSIAGLRNSGTKAAILSFLKHFTKISEGNNSNNKIHSRVVEGVDLDSDGVVDEVEFLE